jgi:hypothetical protein
MPVWQVLVILTFGHAIAHLFPMFRFLEICQFIDHPTTPVVGRLITNKELN